MRNSEQLPGDEFSRYFPRGAGTAHDGERQTCKWFVDPPCSVLDLASSQKVECQ